MPNQLTLLSVISLILLVATSQGRTWTDHLGRKFEATLVKASKDSVILNVAGRQRTIPLSQLSEVDRLFISSAPATSSPQTIAPQPQPTPKSRRVEEQVQIQADLSIPVERLRAEPENRRWVYGSPNFEFICDEDLGIVVVRQFAWMFESVWQFCDRLPYSLPRLKAQQKVRMKTYLISSYENYVRQGGPPGSGGVYKPGLDVILIPFQSLGIHKSGRSYRVDRNDGNYVLRHEVAHQLMVGQTQQAGWFIEGSAEYICTVPYKNNRMLLTHHQKAVVDYIIGSGWQNLGGWRLGRNLKLTHLEEFMQPSYAAFQRRENAYTQALLLYYFFAKFDGDRKGSSLAQYASSLQDGRPEPEAREALLNRRDYQKLEADFIKAWNQVGVRIKFE